MATHQRNPKAPFRTKDQSQQPQLLPRDPDGLDAHRALATAAALAEFRRQTGADLEDALSDLLADLMHWCDRSGQAFPEELRRARYHYAEETKPCPETPAPLSDKL
jgi:hypothetical protein